MILGIDRAELGGICVGCPCDFDGALGEPTDRHQPQTLDLNQPCGCPLGQGHVCRPPWVETHLWPDPPEGPATPTKRSTSLRPPKLGGAE